MFSVVIDAQFISAWLELRMQDRRAYRGGAYEPANAKPGETVNLPVTGLAGKSAPTCSTPLAIWCQAGHGCVPHRWGSGRCANPGCQANVTPQSSLMRFLDSVFLCPRTPSISPAQMTGASRSALSLFLLEASEKLVVWRWSQPRRALGEAIIGTRCL